MTTTRRQIKESHCESCGSTAYEDLITDDGYSACCNEPIIGFGCDEYCNHS